MSPLTSKALGVGPRRVIGGEDLSLVSVKFKEGDWVILSLRFRQVPRRLQIDYKTLPA